MRTSSGLRGTNFTSRALRITLMQDWNTKDLPYSGQAGRFHRLLNNRNIFPMLIDMQVNDIMNMIYFNFQVSLEADDIIFMCIERINKNKIDSQDQ